MRRKTEQRRQHIVDVAYECFWRSGFRRAGVAEVAARAGITKRTLYSYFRSKDDLLAAVLSRYNALALQRLERIGERMPADRDGLVGSYFGQMASWARRTPRWTGSGITRLAIELADLPGHPARSLARHAKATSERWLAGRLAKAGVSRHAERAREVMLLGEGALALMLIHGDPAYIEAAARAAKRLLRR